MNKVVVAVALVGAAVLGTGGTALATHQPGATVIGTGVDNTEGGAYAHAMENARNQCSNRNNVSLISRRTERESKNRWWAGVGLRCN